MEEHECVSWSPNQEWIFRSIKVKPYFPSKDELKKKPLRPDDTLAFEPQDDAFSAIPYQPNHANFQFPGRIPGYPIPPLPPAGKKQKVGKHPVQIQRPGPMVINPGEPFPPVFPFPILPKVTPITANTKKTDAKPPVPQIRHPGPLPFPVEPLILDPNKPTVSPLDTFNAFANPQFQNPANSTAAKDEESSDEDGQSDEGGQGPQIEDDESQEDGSRENAPQQDTDDVESDEEDEEEEEEEEEEEDHDYSYLLTEPPALRNKRNKKQEELSGVKYSDFRLFFKRTNNYS